MRQLALIFVHRVRLSRGFCCRCALTAVLRLFPLVVETNIERLVRLCKLFQHEYSKIRIYT